MGWPDGFEFGDCAVVESGQERLDFEDYENFLGNIMNRTIAGDLHCAKFDNAMTDSQTHS
jgi:hypothetical protein